MIFWCVIPQSILICSYTLLHSSYNTLAGLWISSTPHAFALHSLAMDQGWLHHCCLLHKLLCTRLCTYIIYFTIDSRDGWAVQLSGQLQLQVIIVQRLQLLYSWFLLEIKILAKLNSSDT